MDALTKSTIGYWLFMIGVVASIYTISNRQSFWIIVLSFVIFMLGLSNIVDGEKEKLKREIIIEIEDKI